MSATADTKATADVAARKAVLKRPTDHSRREEWLRAEWFMKFSLAKMNAFAPPFFY
jgi:hypothetical protein